MEQVDMLGIAVILEGIAIVILAIRLQTITRYMIQGFDSVNKSFKSIVGIIQGLKNKSMN